MLDPHDPRPAEARVTDNPAQPADARPSYADLAALDAVRDLIDAPPLTSPQAQGDVMVLPWPPSTTPAIRAERVAAASLVPYDGCAVTTDRSHVLMPARLPEDGSGPRIRYVQLDKGNTIGVLVVEDGTAARLTHRGHADLMIGPGVYVLHRQRRWTAPRSNPRSRARHHRGTTEPVAD